MANVSLVWLRRPSSCVVSHSYIMRSIRACRSLVWKPSVLPPSSIIPPSSYIRRLSSSSSSPPSPVIPLTMRAAVFTRAGEPMRIEQVLTPKPKHGEVVIKVKACGVCHSDLHVINGHARLPSPTVLGHEVCGEIVSLGDGVAASQSIRTDVTSRLAIGTRVSSSFILPCGQCARCASGRDDMCEPFFTYSRGRGTYYDGETRIYRPDGTPVYMFSMGGLAEYACIPATSVFALPSSLSTHDTRYGHSAIIGCAVFTAYGAIKNTADLRAGESVAIIGAGGVGANAIQIAKAFGADHIIAVDISHDKLSLAKQLGATACINGKTENVPQRLLALTGGRGVDVVIEALGRPETITQATQGVVDGGRVVLVGIAAAGVMAPVELTRIVRRQIRILGSYGGRARNDIPELFKLIEASKLDVSSPITRIFNGIDQADNAYQALHRGEIDGRAIIQMF